MSLFRRRGFAEPPTSVFNQILIPAFNNAVRRLLGMQGAPGFSQLSPELQAQLDIFNHAGLSPEFAGLAGTMLFWDSAGAAATALRNNGLQLRNPPGSGLICVVLGWEVDAGDIIAGSIASPTITVTARADARDARFGSAQTIPIELRTTEEAVSTITRSWFSMAVAPRSSLIPVVLIPGGRTLDFQRVAQAQGFNLNIWGYVRPAGTNETNLAT